jgi:hypothetical protein
MRHLARSISARFFDVFCGTRLAVFPTGGVIMTRIVEHIANLAELLEEPMQEKLWEYAELLYVEQVAFESSEPGRWTFESTPNHRLFVATMD